MTVTVSLIVAMANNRVIGVENQLPWHLPADLKHFKATTLGKPIVMGRKTWESIGRPLPGRKNIVISRQSGYVAEGADVVSSLNAGLALAREHALAEGLAEIVVIGGEAIYRSALNEAQKIYLTEVDISLDGDAWFPELVAVEWCETARECYPVTSVGGLGYSFVTLERVSAEC
ncbi:MULTISPECIES: dihydrofolate reductase [Zhongshania]|jgi:dihydrofolate reductase|uniref:Dihydrofolate reductase n=1 Tax=Zhongshania antarctica TaxID=641702 RepID=A0A840R1G0_9GAMM|nr:MULTISPECIES: dihydrofolate reductase [Zhongshania]MBB5186443.1 dihydrofolate reductase [Zhongshania antarctica]